MTPHNSSLSDPISESENRLRIAIESGRIGLWVWNSTDVANAGDWSPRLKEIFGLPPDTQVTHEIFLSRIHVEDRDRVNASVMKALAGENHGEYREQYRIFPSKDGDAHWVTARGQAFFDSEGKPFRFIGTLIDITDQKRAEEASLRATQQLETSVREGTDALKASERLARGQLAALTSTLESLAKESDPDKLPQYVVMTILRQLGAHSVSIWERSEDELDLLGIIEDGTFQTRDEIKYFAGSIPVTDPAPPLWAEALSSSHFIIEDINKEPSRIILVDGRSAMWHALDLIGPFLDMKTHLAEQGVRGLLIAPMTVADKLTGIIGIRFTGTRTFGPEEINLAKALAHQAMLSVQLMKLSQQSRIAAVTAERTRMARDVHDTLAQGFTGVIMQLEAAKGVLERNDLEEAAQRVERAGELARAGLGEARRSVMAIRPRSLVDRTLWVALDEMLKRMTEGTRLQAEFQVEGEGRSLPEEIEDSLLRIAQEALTNSVKHASASIFRANLTFLADEVQLRLVDNGKGFDPHGEHEGFGLVGMKERVAELDGRFVLRSLANEGTEIQITFKTPPPPSSESGGEHV